MSQSRKTQQQSLKTQATQGKSQTSSYSLPPGIDADLWSRFILDEDIIADIPIPDYTNKMASIKADDNEQVDLDVEEQEEAVSVLMCNYYSLT